VPPQELYNFGQQWYFLVCGKWRRKDVKGTGHRLYRFVANICLFTLIIWQMILAIAAFLQPGNRSADLPNKKQAC
jgi:hypothetical protein